MDLDDTQGKHQIPFPRTRGWRIKHQEYKIGSVYLGHADNKSLCIYLKKFFSPLKEIEIDQSGYGSPLAISKPAIKTEPFDVSDEEK